MHKMINIKVLYAAREFNLICDKYVGFSVGKYFVATKFQISTTVQLWLQRTKKRRRRNKQPKINGSMPFVRNTEQVILNTNSNMNTVYSSIHFIHFCTKNKRHIVHQKNQIWITHSDK